VGDGGLVGEFWELVIGYLGGIKEMRECRVV
jgi:hypothetical protein